MRDPFKIEGPAVVSFSGGRTSGYMLWRILQSHGGTLPEDVKVVFCNTGKERPETLDFVERCSVVWGVPVVWLEYRYEGKPSFAVVDYATADRRGAPFEQLIKSKGILPSPVMRYCTIEMKIKTLRRYLKSLGWVEWTNVIGFRFDEPQRVAKLGQSEMETEDRIAPLHSAKVGIGDVRDFWRSNGFDLQLGADEGNCDLCFLKGASKLERIMRGRPDLADWWIQMESESVHTKHKGQGRFCKDRPSYAALLARSQRASLPMMDDEPDELSIACHCTD